MDTDDILSQFDEIERKVEHLNQMCQTLRSENAELREKSTRFEKELDELRASEEHHREVKTLIRGKVDTILQKLEGIAEGGELA